jgi:DNA-directed RNA polymerase specialized sigma24 family protein
MQTTLAPRFNQLVELYYQPVFRFAASLCGSPETALALTQNTFRVARERADQAAAPSNVRQWLFTLLFLQFLESHPPTADDRDCLKFS